MAVQLISLDTECTGLDIYHGARPFLVTIAYEDGSNAWWEWEVDPLTRKVLVEKDDLDEIQQIIRRAKTIVCQHSKFDYQSLRIVMPDLEWDWGKVHDTLIAGHLLHSNSSHTLADMALEYLDLDIMPYESRLKAATKEARAWAKNERPNWRIAGTEDPALPSARESVWKCDLWLPLKAAKERNLPKGHPWWAVLEEYANADSMCTLLLWKKMEELLHSRKLWNIYCFRRRLVPVIARMEVGGVTVNKREVMRLQGSYRKKYYLALAKCKRIAERLGYSICLPKGAMNDSLRTFIFDVLKLQSPKRSRKTGSQSVDKEVINHWVSTLEPGPALDFLKALQYSRRIGTSIQYLKGYQRFWVDGLLHPTINPTGTVTLRMSSNNPNAQNVSKQDVEGESLRSCFGPAKGREWWSLDYANLELRIPAYEAGEEEMIRLFERPDEPPYYGSYHLLVFDLLHPELFEKYGAECKERYKATWYQWVKNGNFAVQYGSVEESGTADRAYHVQGAFARIKQRFRKIHGPGGLNERMIAHAKKYGYVETIPDRTIDPQRGYPLFCRRSNWERVKPTVPLNYHVQGTAMWIATKAMITCSEYLRKIPDARIALQVHDEIVFDLPEGAGLKVVKDLARLMEQAGKDVGVPTPVTIEYHPERWDKPEPISGLE